VTREHRPAFVGLSSGSTAGCRSRLLLRRPDIAISSSCTP
jgi:hypothetical protein